MKMKKSLTAISVAMVLLLSITGVFADVDYIFDNNVDAAKAKNGARSVIYISPEEMELDLAQNSGVFLAVGSGIYTSTDGINWSIRDKSNNGIASGFSTSTSTTTTAARQMVAYGGQTNDKKAFIVSGYSTNNINYTKADLEFAGTVSSFDGDGKGIYITCIVWDPYTQKFWAGANEVDATSANTTKPVTSVGGIYYSDGIIDNGKTVWNKVNLGAADLFSTFTDSTKLNAKYMYIDTNKNGGFVFGADSVSTIGDSRYKCGVLTTNKEVNGISTKVLSLLGGTVITGDADNYTLPSSSLIRQAVIDRQGRVIMAISLIRTGYWYRLVYCDSTQQTPVYTWVPLQADVQRNAAQLGLIAKNDNIIVSLSAWELTREPSPWTAPEGKTDTGTPGNRSNGNGASTVTKVVVDQDTGVMTSRRLIADDVTQERLVYGEYGDNIDIFNSCIAISNNNTVVVTQSVKTSAANYYGRIVTFTPNGDYHSISVTAEENSVNNYGKITVSADKTQIKPGETVNLNSTFTNILTGNAMTAGSDLVSYKLLSTDPDVEMTDEGLITINGNGESPVTKTVRVKAYNVVNPSVFKLKDVVINVKGFAKITVNSVWNGTLQKGNNAITASYNNPIDINKDNVFSCVAVYVNENGSNRLFTIATRSDSVAAGEQIPEVTLNVNIPSEADVGDYSIKAFFWGDMDSIQPL